MIDWEVSTYIGLTYCKCSQPRPLCLDSIIFPVYLYLFMQVWKAAGMDMTNVEFLWASEEINTHANEYWLRVMDIARKFNVPRVSDITSM